MYLAFAILGFAVPQTSQIGARGYKSSDLTPASVVVQQEEESLCAAVRNPEEVLDSAEPLEKPTFVFFPSRVVKIGGCIRA